MRLCLAVALTAVFAGCALAQEGPVIPKPVLDMFPAGEDACYVGRFEPQAMKPKQKLTEFHLYRLFDPNPAKEAVEFTREQAIAFDRQGTNANWTSVLARFNDKPYRYSQTVTCSVWEEGSSKVNCGVDCDGGYFNAAPSGSGLTVSFPSESGGLALSQSCGEPDDEGNGRWMTAQDAGTGFLLERRPKAECMAEDRAAHPAFAEDPMPLRQRIAVSGWRCLKRIYDRAHLAKHPKQMVTAMAVALKGPVKVETSPGEYNYTSLDVALSFKLRNGKVITKDVTCGADEYQFTCDGGFRLRRRDGASAMLVAGTYSDQENAAPVMLDTQLGSDDTLFRLDASQESLCRTD
jgi:hypothetical protein